MNLNLYENVDINRNKTWIDPRYRNLYSREIKGYSMFTILKRYNPKDKCTDFFLVVSKVGDNDHIWDCIATTRSGISKLNLKNYWNLLPFNNKRKEFEVIMEEVDKDRDGVIYYLDI